jgi:antitoxin (DNA-binding transcriptional repressor) of toxin-antitoxin stability system
LIPHGSIPFYIKNGFEGVIKSGTPVAQIIPFKQENWKAEVESGLCEYAKAYRRSSPIDWYKKKARKRKSYD